MTETITSPAPPPPPRLRRGDRLHTIAAGTVAVLAVLGCILIVNLVNDPSPDTTPAASTGPPAQATATAARPASASTAATPAPVAPATSALPLPKETSQSPKAAAPVAPSTTPKHIFAPVVILNNSRETGLAEIARARLEAAGFTVTRIGNYNSTYNVAVPTVFYEPEQEAAAKTMQELIPDVRAAAPKTAHFISDDPLILVITKDFQTDPPE
ncbi:LytR C-terminal domain-containing protein [Candidatus Protofrankia californiensis]|uniref:LytR C-terminal domain-containing protein n=1 Tax=Candidatus Protofrankia californiensis TaxID=1839754 RepID=UPI0010418E47|nr:LytR C-terminal domain-containing protein [Candidatus Protofrankia californiensis]